MLYSIITCIAYIIGIIEGLYLNLTLSMVSFFLFICIYFFIKQNNNFKIFNSYIFIIIIISFLVGLFYTKLSLNNFENKYQSRSFLCVWRRGETS